MPVHPLEERQLPPWANNKFGASRSGDRPAECGAGHCGVDLYYWRPGADKNYGRGRPVFAVADGKVVAARYSTGVAGKFVWVDHGGWRSHYVHLDSYNVGVGDKVRKGQQIGTLGRTGIKTDPAHLHFALSRSGKYYDPEPSLKRWPLAAAAGIGGGTLLVAAAALYWYLKR